MSQPLTTDGQIEKFNYLGKQASKIEKSASIVERIGAFTIHSAFVEFYLVQAARLIEQIVLKGQVRDGTTPTFEPHEDLFFFEKRVKPRMIIAGIKKMLPLRPKSPGSDKDAEIINELATNFTRSASRFLGYRNRIIHHICSPMESLESINSLLDSALEKYCEVKDWQKRFLDTAQPYRFGPVDFSYFYGKPN